MKRLFVLILVVVITMTASACGSTQSSNAAQPPEPVDFTEYPGNTGIEISGAEKTLPDIIFTTTGEENGLIDTLYIIEGLVIEVGSRDHYPYFIVATDSGDVWISEIAETTVQQQAAEYGFEFDLDVLRSYYPMPKEDEHIRVFAQYTGMSGKTNYPSFVYGGEDYLTEAFLLSATSFSDPTDETTSATTTPPTQKGSKENPYRAGMYKVGIDLPAGEYLFLSGSSTKAYVCASSDSNQDDIIENENFSNSFFMTVEDGQYLEAKRCYFLNASDYTVRINEDGTFGDGMYRVGIDIPAGEYRLTAEEDRGYWCLYNNSNIPFDIEDNDNFEGSAYVTVREGQYLIIKRCTAKPVQ